MPVEAKDIEALIRAAFPKARISVQGDDGQHFSAEVVDESFRGLNRVQQQRAVYASLKGKNVGVQRATTTDRYATEVFEPKGINVKRYSNNEEIYMDLAAGRLDAIFADTIPLSDFLSLPRGQGYAFVGPELKDPKYVGEGAGIAVRKGNSALVSELNAAIDGIRANGEYKKIQDKYFSNDIYPFK